MTLIKDLIDLVTQLDDHIKDLKIRELLLPIKEKVHEVEKSQFYLERQHLEQLDDITRKHAEEVSDLKQTIEGFQLEQRQKVILTFSDKTGTYIDEIRNLHYCPACLKKNPPTESSMRDNNHGWTCGVCDKVFDDPDRPRRIGAPMVINPQPIRMHK